MAFQRPLAELMTVYPQIIIRKGRIEYVEHKRKPAEYGAGLDLYGARGKGWEQGEWRTPAKGGKR